MSTITSSHRELSLLASVWSRRLGSRRMEAVPGWVEAYALRYHDRHGQWPTRERVGSALNRYLAADDLTVGPTLVAITTADESVSVRFAIHRGRERVVVDAQRRCCSCA